MADFTPTEEQLAILEAYQSGDSLIVEAGAGTGKTSTIQLLAESDERRGQYVAFNKSIADEAGRKMPGHVQASTAHSLAYRAVGHKYRSRLNGPRMRSYEIAQLLGIDWLQVGEKKLSPGFLAGRVMQAITHFCQSADQEITKYHFPYIQGIDAPDAQGNRTYTNNDKVRKRLLPHAWDAWADLMDEDGHLPFRHDHYLKAWHLAGPYIAADVIFFDEAQDANPVLADIVAQQEHAQLVHVGDSQQQIYGWTGAVNALQQIDAAHRLLLTRSFRFGSAVAEVANVVLSRLETDMCLLGTPEIPSVVGRIDEPAAILCRTNAEAVRTMLWHQRQGERPHLVGGGRDVVSFAKAAEQLQQTGSTWHPELACFESWQEVLEYVELDAQGGELKLLVDLTQRFGAQTIKRALEKMPRESQADVVISTAHKSKGREWASVMLAPDFPADPKNTEDEELRLLYVAATRGRLALDPRAVPWLMPIDHTQQEVA